jgi:hypothetical protein
MRESVDWRFAHPDSDLRLTINFQALLNSPAVVKAIEQGRAQAKGQAKDNAVPLELALGMLKTVDRVSVSARQKAVPAGKANTSGAPAMDVLAQITGSFDPQLIAGFFPSTGTSKVKVVGPHTVLIGEGDSFAKASERMTSGVPAQGDELELNDIWVSARSSFLAQQASGANQPMPPLFQSLRGISLGLNLGEAPEINVLLTTADEAGAGEMLKALQQAAPMAGTAVKGLSLKQDGSKIRAHLVVPPETLASVQQFAQQQAASGDLTTQLAPLLGSLGFGGGGPASSAKPPTRAITPARPPQNGGKIVIYGLDDGPKEIQVQK